MHFGFDDDQIAVRDAVGSFLEKEFPLAALEAAWAAGGAGDDAGLALPVWRDLAGLGVQGLLAPETAGGSGFDEVTLVLVLAETGRAALPLPVVETAAVGVPLLMAAGDPDGLLPALIDGSSVLTVVDGASGLAPAASVADLFLVDGDRVCRRSDVDITPVSSVDRTRDLGRVEVHPGAGMAVGAGDAAVSWFDRAALGTAAQLVGLGREMVRLTVEYVKDRHQFGVPIGSFQAVKHHLADAHLQMEFAAPAVWAAAAAVAASDPDAVRAVSLAKAMASDAAYHAGRAALQCHGAMGYSDEYRLHLWMKRAWCLGVAYGSAAWHRDRIGRELGL